MPLRRLVRDRLSRWPVIRQLDGDPLGLGRAAQSPRSKATIARTVGSDRVVDSICPYCAVGCGQRIFVKDGEITSIEGDPRSPISRGRLCPKGAATKSLVTTPLREYTVKYRRPYGTSWEELSLDEAMQMIADRVLDARNDTWEAENADGVPLRRTRGLMNLGGATLDNEENYLIKKLMTALGVVQVENQARI